MNEEESLRSKEKLKELREAGMKAGSLVEIGFSEEDLHFDDMPGGGHFIHHYSSNGDLKSPDISYTGYVIILKNRGEEVIGLVNSFNRTQMKPGNIGSGINAYGNAIQRYRIISE